jgi:glucosamine--fructose-6-phosphate aminotransferase (isomerizing)
MCGIFAYINYGVPTQQKDIVQKLLNGLRRLEYRGYDSAGIAVDNGPSLDELTQFVAKATGKIDRLAEVVRSRRAAHHTPTPP